MVLILNNIMYGLLQIDTQGVKNMAHFKVLIQNTINLLTPQTPMVNHTIMTIAKV
jgi:hypothetical protein